MPEDVLNNENTSLVESQNEVNIEPTYRDEPELEAKTEPENFDSTQQVENNFESITEETQAVANSNNVNQEILDNLNALDKAESIKQDIERSRVVTQSAQSFLNEIDAQTQKAWSEANAELSKISLHRSVIESEFQSALKNFDLPSATKLEKQIIELSKLYTQKQAEANMVNLKLNEQLSSAFAKWKEWTVEFLDSIKGEDGYKKAYYLIEQIKSMDKTQAENLIKDAKIQASLGVWFEPVKDYVERVVL